MHSALQKLFGPQNIHLSYTGRRFVVPSITAAPCASILIRLNQPAQLSELWPRQNKGSRPERRSSVSQIPWTRFVATAGLAVEFRQMDHLQDVHEVSWTGRGRRNGWEFLDRALFWFLVRRLEWSRSAISHVHYQTYGTSNWIPLISSLETPTTSNWYNSLQNPSSPVLNPSLLFGI